MATSGSFNTSVVGSFYFTFAWERTGYSSSNNEHYINYSVVAHNTAGKYRTVYLKNLLINDNQVFYEAGSSSSAKNYYDGDVVASGSITIPSSNSAGDGGIWASFEAGVASYPGSNCSGSGSWDLDRIPRYLDYVYISQRGRTSTSISIDWSTSHARDWTQYSINGGAWTDAGDVITSDTTGYFTVGGLNPNTTYNIKVRCRRTDSQLWSESGSISIKTYQQTVASIWLDSKGIDWIKVGASCNVSASNIQYRIRTSGSSSFGEWQNSNVFTGLTPNTSYVVQVYAVGKESGEGSQATVSVATYDIAKVTLAHDFNSDVNPYMEFTNPAGATVNLKLEFEGNVIRRNGITGAGGHTFELTEEERKLLYDSCPNSNYLTVRYVVATLANGVETYWHFVDKMMIVVNSNPVFSNCEYKDIGEGSTRLTGDDQIIINGYNYLTAVISTSNKAVAKNGATMSKYRLVCGNQSKEVNYSSSTEVNISLGYVTNMTFVVYAIDSRGNSTAVTKSVAIWKNYFKPVIATGTAERTEQINKETRLTFSGKIWNDNFGEVQNKIVTCKYEYKKTTDKETDWVTGTTEIIPEISGNTFSASVLIKGDADAEGFEITNSYNIKITINDEIYPATYDVLLNVGKPGIAIHRDGVAFGKPYDENIGGPLQVAGCTLVTDRKYYNGSCNDITETCVVYVSGGTDCPPDLDGVNYGYLFTKCCYDSYIVQTFEDVNSNRSWKRTKTSGTWSAWETQAVVKGVTWLSTPLSVNNQSLFDSNIGRAKAIVFYYTFTSNNYRDSVFIPNPDNEWFMVNNYDGKVGYVFVGWANGTIQISALSDSNFKILHYTLIT